MFHSLKISPAITWLVGRESTFTETVTITSAQSCTNDRNECTKQGPFASIKARYTPTTQLLGRIPETCSARQARPSM